VERVVWADVLERVAPSLVALEAPDRQGQPFQLPGVVISEGRVAAWGGLMGRAHGFEALLSVCVRQRDRSWTGSVSNYRFHWMTCSVDVEGSLGLPAAERRRSMTLAQGAELAVVGWRDGRPVLVATAHLLDGMALEAPAEEPYQRSKGWIAQLDPVVPVGGCFVFDAQARLAGVLEPLDAAVAAIIPAERLGAMGPANFLHVLFELKAYPQLIQDFTKALPTLDDPEPFCIAGRALEELGQLERAIDVWRRSLAFDPFNPWTFRAIAGALTKLGRQEEARQWMEEVAKIERPVEG
jgi:hypothetical protein